MPYAQSVGDVLGGWAKKGPRKWVMPSCTGKPNIFWPVVGDDARAERRARGYRFAALLVDEATLLPDSLLHTLLDRLSTPGARAVLTCNPAHPHHEVKRRYIDEPRESEVAFGFSLDDNPILDDEYKASLAARYQGGEHRRMVLGEWAAMEGQIWPSELIDRACGAPPVGDRTGYLLAVDYAHSSVTHALLLARSGEEMWVLGEWRHDAKKRGQLSEPEQAERIVTHLVAGHPVARVVVDPSAPAMRAALADALRLPARGAVADVVEGVQLVRRLMDVGRLRINHKACSQLVREMHGYVWDERWARYGEDRPVKHDDHGCDALRYAVHTGAEPQAAPVILTR